MYYLDGSMMLINLYVQKNIKPKEIMVESNIDN